MNKNSLSAIIIDFFERFNHWEECMAREVGLTPRQCHAVVKIGEAGIMPMKPLAELLGITTGTLTILINRLEKQGLCKRVGDTSDKRVYHIELTAAGENIYKRHENQHRHLMDEIFALLPAEDCLNLERILKQINNFL